MSRLVRDPKDKNPSSKTPFNWDDFVSSIIQGEYVLLVGSEVMLKNEFGNGDVTKSILDAVTEELKVDGLLGEEKSFNSFTELARETGRSDIKTRQLIIEAFFGSDTKDPFYVCPTEEISNEIRQLIRSKFFRVVMTTTFDTYLENLMKEVWGENGFRIMNIYGDGLSLDISRDEQNSTEFNMKPTLYYICGKVNTDNKKFVATDNDAIEVIARWFSNNAPKNFLQSIRQKGVISVGCKFDDWLFRFFWYILRQNVNNIDNNNLKDAVAVSFASESDKKLNTYLKSKNVYTESDSRKFITRILEHKEHCLKSISMKYTQLGGIFVSYAHEDMPLVSTIVKRLKKEGFNIWFDATNLSSGDDYDKRIINAITQCKVFIPILSPQVRQDIENGNTNRYYIKNEWSLAMQNANIGSDDFHIMPLGINGYDENYSYHKQTPFSKITVSNILSVSFEKFISDIRKNI